MTETQRIGFLHPGAMGEALAATCRQSGLWASEGRSVATHERAERAGLQDVGTIADLSTGSDVIVSICPPAAALDVARQIAATGFSGLYVDANAIAPDVARSIDALFANFVDGSVIGPPPRTAGSTRLYLSGPGASEVAALWQDTPLDARVMDGAAGSASALKMAYASWTKIGAALQTSIRALAASEGVADELLAEWTLSQPALAERGAATVEAVAPKAWRFVGEMEQIAATFVGANLPAGFAQGAAETYQRMATFKGQQPTAANVIDQLRTRE